MARLGEFGARRCQGGIDLLFLSQRHMPGWSKLSRIVGRYAAIKGCNGQENLIGDGVTIFIYHHLVQSIQARSSSR
jgi:hypothetical protein